MQPSLRRKLEALAERREELERLLADPGVIGDAKRFRQLSREFAQLEPIATALADEAAAKADLAAAQAMRNDPELGELAEEEIAAATERLEQLDAELLAQMIPKDPRDDGDIFRRVLVVTHQPSGPTPDLVKQAIPVLRQLLVLLTDPSVKPVRDAVADYARELLRSLPMTASVVTRPGSRGSGHRAHAQPLVQHAEPLGPGGIAPGDADAGEDDEDAVVVEAPEAASREALSTPSPMADLPVGARRRCPE